MACGKPLFDARDTSALLNPALIVEVLSASTEAYDRGDKFALYKKLDSLQEYMLMAQDHVCVEVFTRQQDGLQNTAKYASLDDILDLPAIGCRLAVRDVYDKVEFGS